MADMIRRIVLGLVASTLVLTLWPMPEHDTLVDAGPPATTTVYDHKAAEDAYRAEATVPAPTTTKATTPTTIRTEADAGVLIVEPGSWPEWHANDQASPHRGEPGYVQAEDGSWVRESFYARPTPATTPAQPAEDDPAWDWRTHGNRMRGICVDGTPMLEHADGRIEPGGRAC